MVQIGGEDREGVRRVQRAPGVKQGTMLSLACGPAPEGRTAESLEVKTVHPERYRRLGKTIRNDCLIRQVAQVKVGAGPIVVKDAWHARTIGGATA